jgi:membrane associated rhomboid family serine protease
MAYSTRSYGFSGLLTPVVKQLLIANVAVFAVLQLLGAAFDFNWIDWFAFHPTRIFLRPWGVFTYMFLHGGLLHLAVNMLVLFFFGPPLESQWGGRAFLRYYIVCGLGGVALSYLFLDSPIVGASAAMYGLMLAFAINWPDAPIYVWGIFPVKAKWLVAFLFALSLFNALDPAAGGGVAHLAHLGGIAAGFIYLKSGWRPSAPAKRVTRSGEARRLAIVPREARDAVLGGHAGVDRRPDEDKALYDAVDRVLDKISAEGMGSLTPDELRLLDEVSKRHRAN